MIDYFKMKMKLTALIFTLLSQASSSELISVQKEVLKEGLHRDLVTNVTFTIKD